MKTPPEKLQQLAEMLKNLPEYLEEKRKRRQERAEFVERIFGDAWRVFQARVAEHKNKSLDKTK